MRVMAKLRLEAELFAHAAQLLLADVERSGAREPGMARGYTSLTPIQPAPDQSQVSEKDFPPVTPALLVCVFEGIPLRAAVAIRDAFADGTLAPLLLAFLSEGVRDGDEP